MWTPQATVATRVADLVIMELDDPFGADIEALVSAIAAARRANPEVDVSLWRSRWAMLALGSGNLGTCSGVVTHLLSLSPAGELQTALRSRGIRFKLRHASRRRREAIELRAVATGARLHYI